MPRLHPGADACLGQVTESDDPDVYPGTTILRNRLGLRDSGILERVERRLVVQRIREGVHVAQSAVMRATRAGYGSSASGCRSRTRLLRRSSSTWV